MKTKAFTLIELLIVVAIIAILAAIAVPNFLEAQTRSKVTRVLADTRSMKVGLESYQIDNNHYPETDQGLNAAFNAASPQRSILRLTTPIAYLSSIFTSPFNEVYGSSSPTDPKLATKFKSYLYVRKEPHRGGSLQAGVNADYYTDRSQYLGPYGLASTAQRDAVATAGSYLMKSVGPNNVDDRDASNPKAVTPARIYDPTNGTISAGEVIVFSDVGGSLK